MSVSLSGSLAVTGSVIATSFTGSLQGAVQSNDVYSYTFLLMGA
jgi:hypothetical protein